MIKDDPKLKTVNNQINHNKESECNEKDLEHFLDEYDDLALYWSERMVRLKHIKETHGVILRKIKSSDMLQEFIKKRNQDDETVYTNLIKIFKKI